MSKTATRFFCSLMALILVFCLCPKMEVQAGDEEIQISIDYMYSYDFSSASGTEKDLIDAYVQDKLPALNPVNLPETVAPGESLNIPMPQQTDYLDKENGVRCIFGGLVNGKQVENILILIEGYDEEGNWYYIDSTKEQLYASKPLTITMPDASELKDYTKVTATVKYSWGGHVYGFVPDNSGSVSNWVESVTRTVRQDDVALQPQEVNGKETYQISDTQNIEVSYSATMNMENVTVVDESGKPIDYMGFDWWDLLKIGKKYIYDNTYVDIHIQFDPNLDLEKAIQDGLLEKNDAENRDGLTLTSDMFTLSDPPYTVDDSTNELIIHCHWDSEKAESATTLDPVITLSGIVLPVKETWTGDALDLNSQGYIEGLIYMSLYKDPNYHKDHYGYHDDWLPLDEWMEDYIAGGYKDNGGVSYLEWVSHVNRAYVLNVSRIDGGDDSDSFTLAFPTPETPTTPENPVEEPEDEEEEEEPDTTNNSPYLKINGHWDDDSTETRPESITVDVYHEGTYYTTVEIYAKYGWMGGTNIPERWKDDDWWVVPKDIPIRYDTDVEETRQLVFNLQSVYKGLNGER